MDDWTDGHILPPHLEDILEATVTQESDDEQSEPAETWEEDSDVTEFENEEGDMTPHYASKATFNKDTIMPLKPTSQSSPPANPAHRPIQPSKMSDSQCAKTFKHYVEVTSVLQSLTEADKREIKDKGMSKMLKECCGDAVVKASEAQVFPKYCDRKTKKLHLKVFLGDFILELAAAVIHNHKNLSKRPELTDPEVVQKAYEIKSQIAAKNDEQPKEVKVDPVTARLTNTKGYTGTHKERFDDQGKGKGLTGRMDIVDASGYVTGYKGQNTFNS